MRCDLFPAVMFVTNSIFLRVVVEVISTWWGAGSVRGKQPVCYWITRVIYCASYIFICFTYWTKKNTRMFSNSVCNEICTRFCRVLFVWGIPSVCSGCMWCGHKSILSSSWSPWWLWWWSSWSWYSSGILQWLIKQTMTERARVFWNSVVISLRSGAWFTK